MAELAYDDVFTKISSELLNRAVLGTSALDAELEANRPIYELFEEMERDDYDRAVQEEQEAYQAHMNALYGKRPAFYAA